ncbi:YkgJ family cysteine cluster protein [Pseudomonadales bacterium]|nr:YkgJ family cysteine cluster protein [Pseudomonadales bacterium]
MSSAHTVQACVAGCGACCIAPHISSPIPGMPKGKPAGVRCVQLDADNACMLFGLPSRPAVCLEFSPQKDMCSNGSIEALRWLTDLEQLTVPN